MKKLINYINNHKHKKLLMTILITLLVAIVFGISYAFLGPLIGDEARTNIDIQAQPTDVFRFEEGDPILLEPGSHNLNDQMGNLVATTTPSATLLPAADTAGTTDNYYMYINITNNTFVYSQSDNTPELILTIADPDGNEVTSLTGLNHTTINGVSGFDVTTYTGLLTLANNKEISATPEGTTHNWVVTLTMLNLPVDQSLNAESSLSAKILFQREEYTEPFATYLIANHSEEQGLLQHTSSLTNGAGDDNYRYSGSNSVVSNNWVCFGSDVTPCPEENKYRIIGIYDGSVKLIKATAIDNDGDGVLEITDSGQDTFQYDGGNSNDYETSDIKAYLNGEFYNTIPVSYQSIIKESTWYVGGNDTSDETASEFYRDNIGSPVKNKTSTGKIGLMYVSDYGYAAHTNAWTTDLSGYSNQTIKDNNWLFNLNSNEYEWTIVPNSNYSFDVWSVNYLGSVGNRSAHYGSASRPVLYLESSAKILGGTGSEAEPFRIGM